MQQIRTKSNSNEKHRLNSWKYTKKKLMTITTRSWVSQNYHLCFGSYRSHFHCADKLIHGKSVAVNILDSEEKKSSSGSSPDSPTKRRSGLKFAINTKKMHSLIPEKYLEAKKVQQSRRSSSSSSKALQIKQVNVDLQKQTNNTSKRSTSLLEKVPE